MSLVPLNDPASLPKPLEKLLVAELRKELERRGLSTQGLKADLAARLRAYFEEQKAQPKTPTEDKMDVDNEGEVDAPSRSEKPDESEPEKEKGKGSGNDADEGVGRDAQNTQMEVDYDAGKEVETTKKENEKNPIEREEQNESEEKERELHKDEEHQEKDKEREKGQVLLPRTFALAMKETVTSEPSAPKDVSSETVNPSLVNDKPETAAETSDKPPAADKPGISLAELRRAKEENSAKTAVVEEKPKPNREPLKRSRDAEVETMPVKRPRVVLDEVEYTPSGEEPPESEHPPSRFVLMKRLSRPLNVPRLRTLIETFGELKEPIKFSTYRSRGVLEFVSVEGAMAARRNLWKADFEMSKKIELEFISEPDIAKHLEAEAVELKKGPSSAAPSLPTTRDDQLKKKAEPDEPMNLEKYFRKTVAQPPIYYLPLTDAEVEAKKKSPLTKYH